MVVVYTATSTWSSSRLLNLPPELQLSVLENLGWKDLIAIRQTCRELFALSSLRQIWTALFHRLSRELVVPWVLEQPLKTYSVNELERLVARRVSAETRWNEGVPPAETRKPVDFPFEDDPTILLDGGRWMLKTIHEMGVWGIVYVYDLEDDEEHEWKCLVDLGASGYTNQNGPAWVMSVDTVPNPDYDAASAFNLCLMLDGPLRAGADGIIPEVDDICIYRITIDGVGKDACLTAVEIKSLRGTEGTNFLCYDASLRGDYLVKGLQLFEFHNSFIFDVYNWVLSNASLHVKARIIAKSTPGTRGYPPVLLIPDGKLVLFSDYISISIYDLARMKAVRDSKCPTILEPYWVSASLQVATCYGFSRSYRDESSSRATVVWGDRIYGLSIPHDTMGNATLQYLSDVDLSGYYWTPFVGIGKVYASIADEEEDEEEDEDSDHPYMSPEGSSLDLIPIPLHWDDFSTTPNSTESLGVPIIRQSTPKTVDMGYKGRYVPPFFDECSNRFLILSDSEWIVRDFASPHLL